MIPQHVKLACSKALELGLPFACFRRPGEKEVVFLADTEKGECKSDLSFEICPWNTPYSRRIAIRDRLGIKELLELSTKIDKKICYFSDEVAISREEYIAAVGGIISNCRHRNGKTVYSRVIAGINPGMDIPEVVARLFAEFPKAFGFLYFTPQTGCWLGATPEILLSANLKDRTFATMALAGTRSAVCGDAAWDDKNLRENCFVADFFREKFSCLGLDYNISAPTSLSYGPIQHLCRNIHGRFSSQEDIETILDAINPTPALCGTPTSEALRDIETFERHRRQCYGGLVGVRTSAYLDTYVNLRSARIACDGSGRFNIFAGGGITADSDPETEFQETAAKASRLLAALSVC